jgi:hypothetical protein
VLYQLSYIGENQHSAISRTLPSDRCQTYFGSLPPSECSTSFRRTQVFSANIASTATVAKRIRWSLIVFQDKIPKATYAANAMTKRFTRSLASLGISAAGSRCAHARKAPQIPGAQGRIRTFVPRKEGQIYSLLALTTHPPVQKTPARLQRRETSHPLRLRAQDDATAGNDPIEEQSARDNPLARKHHTWNNSLWSAVGKNLLRCRAAQNVLCSGTDPH